MKCPHCKKEIKKVYVKVISAKYSTYWYSNDIGNVFQAFLDEEDYRLEDGERVINADDCIVVSVKRM